MAILESTRPYEAILFVLAPEKGGDGFPLHLMDLRGHEGRGCFRLDFDRSCGVLGGLKWGDFLDDFLKIDVSDDELNAFSVDLFQGLIIDSGLLACWREILGAAGDAPLVLTVELSEGTEAFAALPLELLHDNENFVFARPGSGIQRALLKTPARPFVPRINPRLLLAWARPPCSGYEFDPGPHIEALSGLFVERLAVLPEAGWKSILDALLEAERAGKPYDYFHLMAHGYGDEVTRGVCLHGPDGGLDYVTAERFGAALKGRGLELAFLCSCQAGVTGSQAFSGVGQQLMAIQGGDLPCVVATQANLPVKDSEILVRRFYELLLGGDHPSQALARARRDAYSGGGCAWSVPILLTRPARAEVFTSEAFVRGLPEKRITYQPREIESEGLEALRAGRLVSLVGLPGIGKTETGKEIARQAKKEGIFDRVIYQEVQPGFTPDLLRAMVAAALGQTDVKDDYSLAAILEGQRQRILLVLDNAEDLMKDLASEGLFRDQVNVLLGKTQSLKILMTTRWILSGADIHPRIIDLPPMSHEEMSRLLAAELKEMGVLQDDWIESESWRGLLKLLDGHPRSLWLTSHHFQTRPGADPAFVLSRLSQYKTDAVLDPGLFGRRDVFEALKDDQKARLKSLVASMDFSFEVLEGQFPDAAEVYLGFSLFPSGLPESVALKVAGGIENAAALDQIYRYHLAAWNKERVFYPVPLQWYAEKRRREREFDEEKYMRRAVESFADYVESCDSLITSGSIIAGLDRLLIEETTLEALAEWIDSHGDHGDERCFSGRIARAAANGLLYAHHYEKLSNLIYLGLVQTQKNNDRMGEANCLQSMGDLKMRTDDLDGAEKAYEQALPIFREIRARMGEANCLKSMGDLKMRTSDLDGAEKAYEQALPIFREIRARMGEANCLQSMGDLKMRTSDLDGAEKAYEQALPIFREIRARMGEAYCLFRMGDLKMRTDDLDGAEKAYEQALPIFREIRARMGEANCLQSMGDLKMRTDDLDGAEKAYEQALPIFREIRARMGEANCLQSMGDLKMRTDDLDGAEKAYEQALPIFREIRDRMGEANCLKSMGDLKMRTSDLDGAEKAYEQALPIYREIRARMGEAYCLQSQGLLELMKENPIEAFKLFKHVLGIFSLIKITLGYQSVFGYMAQAAHEAMAHDHALLLAEKSLEIGRAINDRFGQTISLNSQIQVWLKLSEVEPLMASLIVLLALYNDLGNQAAVKHFSGVIEQIKPSISEDKWNSLIKDPEAIRQAYIKMAEDRFNKTGRDLLDPPVSV